MEKRPTWWKMFASQRAAIESIPDTAAGAGIKAAFRYFDGEEISSDSMDPLAYTAFCLIKPFIDQSLSEYETSVEAGKKGASARWSKGTDGPPIAPHAPPIGSYAEERR